MKQFASILLILLSAVLAQAADTTRLVGTTCEVFVNRFPLVDRDDQLTPKTSIAYNEAGMDLVWNFETLGGEITQAAVTPTNAGAYKWRNVGKAMYSITIPAADNTRIGTGFFVGICDDVVVWRGPTVEFVEARGR